MTCNEFIENLRDLNDGQNFPRDLLRSIYYSIKEQPIPWAAALEEMAAAAAAAAEEQNDPVKQVMSTFSDAGALLRTTGEDESKVGDECTAAEEDAIVEPTLVDGEAKYFDGFLTMCERWVESEELITFYTSQGVFSTTIDGLVLQSKYSYYPATDEWVQECVAYAFDTDENWYLDC